MAKSNRNTTKSNKNNYDNIAFDGQLPPHSIEFEQAVLGALMLEEDGFIEVQQLLKPESFYFKPHRYIYEAMHTLSLREHPVDMLTVTEELRKTGNLESAGGPTYIAELTRDLPSISSLSYHAQVVADKSLSRALIDFAGEVLSSAYEDSEDVVQQMQRAEGHLFELSRSKMKKDFARADAFLPILTQKIEEASKCETGISGLVTGFPELDTLTSGLHPGELIIIGARPAMGKTAFALSLLKTLSVDMSIPTLFFSLEMSNESLMMRVLSNVCEIPLSKLRSGQLEYYEWETLAIRKEMLCGKPLYLDETPGLSIFELRSKARRAVREKGVQLIVIDYLQLMTAEGLQYGSREQEISLISRSLKSLAKELQIPIIALAQLNRDIEKRQQSDSNSRQPQLSDLRESGSIEQDADIVGFLHRPEVYNILTFQEDNTSTVGMGVFVLAKNRNGATGDFRMTFRKEFTKFTPVGSGNIASMDSSIGYIPTSENFGREEFEDPF